MTNTNDPTASRIAARIAAALSRPPSDEPEIEVYPEPSQSETPGIQQLRELQAQFRRDCEQERVDSILGDETADPAKRVSALIQDALLNL